MLYYCSNRRRLHTQPHGVTFHNKLVPNVFIFRMILTTNGSYFSKPIFLMEIQNGFSVRKELIINL